MSKLFVYKNLTRRRKRLFWKTKQAAKEAGYNYVWTRNGKIFVLENENISVIAIYNESDIVNFFDSVYGLFKRNSVNVLRRQL